MLRSYRPIPEKSKYSLSKYPAYFVNNCSGNNLYIFRRQSRKFKHLKHLFWNLSILFSYSIQSYVIIFNNSQHHRNINRKSLSKFEIFFVKKQFRKKLKQKVMVMKGTNYLNYNQILFLANILCIFSCIERHICFKASWY